MWNRETPVSLIGPGGGVSLRTKMRPFRALVLMPEVGCCLLKLHSIHECICCPKVPFLRNIASDIFSTLGMTHTMKGEVDAFMVNQKNKNIRTARKSAQRFHYFLRSVFVSFCSKPGVWHMSTIILVSFGTALLLGSTKNLCFIAVGAKTCMLDTLKKVTFSGGVCVSPQCQHFFSLQANLRTEDVSNVTWSVSTKGQKTCPTQVEENEDQERYYPPTHPTYHNAKNAKTLGRFSGRRQKHHESSSLGICNSTFWFGHDLEVSRWCWKKLKPDTRQ